MTSPRFKILLFNESAGPGGAERVVFNLAQGFKQQGADVGVATLRTGWLTEHLEENGITHHLLRSRSKFDFLLPWKISRLIKKEKYSIIHSHLLDSNFYAAIGSTLAGVPHLATEHGDVHHSTPRKRLGIKLKTLSFFGSTVSAVSEYTADKLAEHGIPRENIRVIGNPVTLEFWHDEQARQDVRGDLQLGPRDFLWINVANLRPVKDHSTLLKGFALACEGNSKRQKLALVGDGELREELEKQAQELGIAGKVHFAGHREDVWRWLAAADGFILSSKSEALPMSLLEAASKGLIIISSDVGGVGELIRNNETGFLFRSGDHVKLSKLINAAYGPTSKLLAKNCNLQVVNMFSVEIIVKSYLKTYLELLHRE
jgi:glycosyltransferase involved in cell wall biosynthesis